MITTADDTDTDAMITTADDTDDEGDAGYLVFGVEFAVLRI